MHYNLLFNGCSFTYGDELQGIINDTEYRRINRFSHLVAEHFGMTYENISKSGSSNDWIIEKTIEWFESGNTCDTAIIQLTLKNRTLWYDEDEQEIFISPQNNHGKKPKVKLISDLYYKSFYSDFLGNQNACKNLFILEQYLKNKNINLITMQLPFQPHKQSQSKEIKQILFKGWGNFCDSYVINIFDIVGTMQECPDNYCKDLNIKGFYGRHPNELGHQKIANYLIEEINNAL